MNTINKRARRGVKMMKVVVTKKEKLVDKKLRRRIKESDRERLILVSGEHIARGQRLFAARSNEMETGKESEVEIKREMKEKEAAKRN